MKRKKINWPATLKDFEKSGKSVNEFCKEQKIATSNFYNNKKKLGLNNPIEKKLKPIKKKTSEKRSVSEVTVIHGKAEIRLQNASPDFLAELIEKLG